MSLRWPDATSKFIIFTDFIILNLLVRITYRDQTGSCVRFFNNPYLVTLLYENVTFLKRAYPSKLYYYVSCKCSKISVANIGPAS
jgi:hypothetical protein